MSYHVDREEKKNLAMMLKTILLSFPRAVIICNNISLYRTIDITTVKLSVVFYLSICNVDVTWP